MVFMKKWFLGVKDRLVGIALVSLVLILLVVSQFWVFDFNLRQIQGQHLSTASQDLLNALNQPLEIRAYVGLNDIYIRQAIVDLVGRYQLYKPDMYVTFVDPEASPAEIREQGVKQVGELRLLYANKQAEVSILSEQGFSLALQQLSRDELHWIAFLQGHGERDPEGKANFDLSHWASHLRSRGLLLQNLYLSEIGRIPDNTKVLVLASPRVNLLPEEVAAIVAYVDKGGHLLWLLDPNTAPDPLLGLGSVATYLGLKMFFGTVIDLGSRRLFGEARDKITLVKDYADHPIGVGLQNQLAILPESIALAHLGSLAPDSVIWEATPLLTSIADTWLETGNIQKSPVFDARTDKKGPLDLSYALSRIVNGSEQRIVVVGDGDFLSNQFLENSANLDLGLNMLNWLVKDDHLLNIPAHQRADAALYLSDRVVMFLSFGFLLVLPLGFLGLGLWVWLRER